jgi:Type I phosphodiesterase / nucleotide pyrophosphatase
MRWQAAVATRYCSGPARESRTAMLYSVCSRIALVALLSAPLALFDGIPAHAQSALRTRNVVLIVSDGLRWQEIFTGADPTLLNESHGGIWDKEQDLRREFWRDDPLERRRALFPFLWNTVAVRGQIFGNQAQGSVARVTNGLAFSYPGYNEMLTGHPDPKIDSNEFGPNPNISVFEWLNTLPELHGKVSVFATWAVFKDIFNVARSHLPLQVGWDPPYQGELSERQALLNRLYQTTTRLDDEDVYNAFQQVPLLDSFAKQQPQVLFVGYGETDNWAHAGRYDLVLHSAHLFDRFVGELWERLQALPAYRDRTTFIITTDHGRGSGPTEWKEHGIEQKGSENIWIAVLGPDTPSLGERRHIDEVHQAQIAATVAALLGKDFRQAVPAAAPPIGAVLGRSR